MKDKFEVLKEKYNEINNSFKEKLVFHVGESAGFYSECYGMMQCMLYCYMNKIKFVLYADDVNWANGHGWNEFFDSFVEENHDSLNKNCNSRYTGYKYGKKNTILRVFLKMRNRAKYLTSDIFKVCIPIEYSQNTWCEWPLFGISGTNFDESGKLAKMALHYNVATRKEINDLIYSLNLPKSYISVQFRGGDKISEYSKLIAVDDFLKKVSVLPTEVSDVFVFSDDYRYIKELEERKTEWNIYTLCNRDEKGYHNDVFNDLEWNVKRKNLIKLFAMVELCIQSDFHFGNEQANSGVYIRSRKDREKYIAIK